MESSQAPKISFQGIKKSFGEKRVLQNLNLDIYDKEAFVIIGPSGCGKSVLLKIMLGFLELDAGRVLVDDIDVTHGPTKVRQEFLKKVSIVFQGGALFDSLTIWENVAFGLINGQGVKPREARSKAGDALQKVGLAANVMDLYPSELSGGMQKRVAFARGIIMEPEILLFDEPTTGLDPIMTSLISQIIADLQKDLGITTLTITHDMRCVKQVADRVGLLLNGAIEWCGTYDEMQQTNQASVHQFIHGELDGPLTKEA